MLRWNAFSLTLSRLGEKLCVQCPVARFKDRICSNQIRFVADWTFGQRKHHALFSKAKQLSSVDKYEICSITSIDLRDYKVPVDPLNIPPTRLSAQCGNTVAYSHSIVDSHPEKHGV